MNAARATRKSLGRSSGVALAVLCMLGGCASAPFPKLGNGKISEQRAERDRMLLQQYNQRRDQALYQAALSRLQMGDESGCIEAIEQLLDRSPNHVESRLLLADILLLDDNPAEARVEIEAALAQNPEHPLALHAMGLLLESVGEGEQAVGYFRRASELEPRNALYKSSYQEAVQDANREHTPKIAPAAYVAVSDHAVSPRQASGSNEFDTWNESSSPGESAGLGQLPESVRRAARYGAPVEAVEAVNVVLHAEPWNSRLPALAALCALRHERLETAEAVLASATARFPQSAELHRLRGVLLYRQGRLHESQHALRQALSLDKADPLSYFLLGSTLERQGQRDAAADCFRQARRLDPSLQVQR